MNIHIMILTQKILCGLFLILMSGCFDSGSNTSNSSGEAGSTAKFLTQNNHLISIEDRLIKVFSIEDTLQPTLINTYKSRQTLETIFPYNENKIMLGTNSGVIIMDHSVPGELSEISFLNHAISCDPVIADNNYMYVTLRSGSFCGVDDINELQIINIEDLTRPVLVKTIELDQPWGLGLNGETLYICLKSELVAIDVSEPEAAQEIGRYSVICNDIIASEPMILTSDEDIKIISIEDLRLIEHATISKGL